MAEPHGPIPYLKEIVVFLVAAGLLVPLLQRFRVSGVLGYLLIGVVIGPFGLGALAAQYPILSYITITDTAGVRQLAELGIVFLLFTIGLELSPDKLWRMRTLVLGLGGVQVLICGAVIGMIAYYFGNSPEASIVLGLALALSSTAIVMKLLADQKRASTRLGRAVFAVLLLQDLAVVPLLVLTDLLAAGSGETVGIGWVMLDALVRASIAIAAILLIGRLIIRPVFRFVGARRSPELFMAVTLLAIVGTAALTWSAGLSMALGAFLAGLLLSETEYRHQIETDIDPYKGLLLALFFVSVGMGIDLRYLSLEAFWICVSVIGLMAIKMAIIVPLGIAFGLRRSVAFETGLLLSQGGEFAFVIVGIGAASGLITNEVAQFMLIVTGLTMFITPFVAGFARRVAGLLDQRGGEDTSTVARFEAAKGLEGHVVIAGFGRVGSLLADVLAEQNIVSVGLDLDAVGIAKARKQGRQVYFGDASRAEVLRRVACGRAQALVVTMDNSSASEEVLRIARAAWPNLPIHARARDITHAKKLLNAGADTAVPENLEASLQLAQDVLVKSGVPSEAAWRQIENKRVLSMSD